MECGKTTGNRKIEFIDTALINFEEEYSRIYRGVCNNVTLFAGDDNISSSPRSIMLARKPELVCVEYSELFKYFKEIFKYDAIGEAMTFKIKKTPPAKDSDSTLLLSNFVKNNKNKDHEYLDIFQTRYNLKPTSKGEDVQMLIDLYLMPEVPKNIPIAEIWTLRKYQRNIINQDNK